jgi:acetyl esterase/lipase
MGLIRGAAPLLALALAACSPAALLNATVSSSGITVTHDIPYAPGARGTLDVYRPTLPGGPLVVFLYGGSWRMGDKAMYAFVGRPLAALGAVVVIPDYRLYPEVQFPAFLDDNARAVAWAAAHAADLGADPRSIFVVGHSAGAYNAAMLALDPAYLARAGLPRDRLAGVVGIAGPYDFLPIVDPDIIPVFASVDDGPASQPINHVDGANPPMLLLAGDADTTVRPRNTRNLVRRIGAAHGQVENLVYPGVGHIGIITAFAPLFAGRAPVLDDVWDFIQRHRPAD